MMGLLLPSEISSAGIGAARALKGRVEAMLLMGRMLVVVVMVASKAVSIFLWATASSVGGTGKILLNKSGWSRAE